MLKVIPNDKYTESLKANADTKRWDPALTKMVNKILSIGGRDFDKTLLSSVSYYDIERDKWIGGLPQL